MKNTPTARWAGSHPTNTRANGYNTTNNNQQPSKHPAHKTRPGQDRKISYPHAHNLSMKQQPIRIPVGMSRNVLLEEAMH